MMDWAWPATAGAVVLALLFRGVDRRRVELNHDNTLCFGRLAIHQGRLIAPLANSVGDDMSEVRRAIDWVHALDAPVLADSGSDTN